MTAPAPFNADIPASTRTIPESEKSPRFSRCNEVEFEIQNHPILQDIGKRFNTDVLQPDAPSTSQQDDFYARLNIAARIETDNGKPFQIDVQPDTRYMVHYLMFTTSHEYPELNVKGYPYTSLPSIVAYKLALVYGHYLLNDLTCRTTRSLEAAPFTNDPELMRSLHILKYAPVPEDVKTLLTYIAPVQDTQRTSLDFVPTFAGFSFGHDFGYTIPINVFLNIHDILASNRTNADPSIIIAKIYNSIVLTVDGTNVTLGNLFGGPYSDGADTLSHSNWLNLALMAFINPVVTRALMQRPTFARTNMTPLNVDDPNDVPSYQYLLGNPLENQNLLEAIITDVSRFFNDNNTPSTPLGTLLSQTSGVNLMTHSIEPYVLPTWHSFPPIAIPAGTEIVYTQESDKTFAEKTHFLSDVPAFTDTLPYPDDPAEIEPSLYLVNETDYDPTKSPITYASFDARKNIRANTLWFQPYDKSRQSIELGIPLGFKIISEEIDAVTIPTPNIDLNLTENNSFYLQGAIPIDYVKKYSPSQGDANALIFSKRTTHPLHDGPLTLAVRNMSINVLPILGNTNVNAILSQKNGLTPVKDFNDLNAASTILAWKSTSHPLAPKNSFILWSSYRFVDEDQYNESKSIHMYSSLRALFGTCITLSRTVHPSKMIPA